MKRKELVAILKGILETLAAQETPPPKPKPTIPRKPTEQPSLRQFADGRLEVFEDGAWKPAFFRPRDYTRGDDGWYWKVIHWPPTRRY